MRSDADLVERYADGDLALAYVFVRLRVEAGKAAADLLAAATAHAANHGNGDPWTVSACAAAEALADIAAAGFLDFDPTADRS